MQNLVLQVQDLSKVFHTKSWFKKESKIFTAVNHISFGLKQGEILGFLGPNGAGKTTTIQMLLSTMTPTSGKILYFGKDFSTNRSDILQHVSFASAYAKLPGRLTVYENLDLYASIYGLSLAKRQENIKKFLMFFDMWNLKDREAGGLSAGQTTRIMLAKAFMIEPKIVLLDEPTASLDPDIAMVVREFVIEQRKEYGVSILFTSHNMSEVTEVCDRVLMLKNGNIIADNTPEQLAASISSCRVSLFVPDSLDKATEFLGQRELIYKIEEKSIVIEVDEHKISDLLIDLARNNITYAQISIEKPSLEDYFLHIVKSHNGNNL